MTAHPKPEGSAGDKGSAQLRSGGMVDTRRFDAVGKPKSGDGAEATGRFGTASEVGPCAGSSPASATNSLPPNVRCACCGNSVKCDCAEMWDAPVPMLGSSELAPPVEAVRPHWAGDEYGPCHQPHVSGEAVRPAREGSKDLPTPITDSELDSLAWAYTEGGATPMAASTVLRLVAGLRELKAANKALAEDRQTVCTKCGYVATSMPVRPINEQVRALCEEKLRLEAAARVMLEALREYGTHLNCSSWVRIDSPRDESKCDCGFRAAIKAGEDVLREEKP